MANTNDLVKLAVDSINGKVEKYSTAEANEVLRNAIIEANNGKTYLDYRDIRDGKCNGLFSLIEVLIAATIPQGVQNDAFVNGLVDFRNVAEGDSPIFEIENGDLYMVMDIANGTQSVRRQRYLGVNDVQIPTHMKAIRIYEELNRILAKRVDFNQMIDRVSASFENDITNSIFTLWSTVTSDQLGGATYFPAAGAYNEDTLLDLISHVEAAAGGKTATIIGTKKALRVIKESILSDSAKDEYHNFGYAGKFYGTPVVALPQRHKAGTTEFALSDNSITIVAGDDKPIKFVYEGDPLIIPGNPINNADLTQEYFYGLKVGLGLATAGNAGIGRYDFT